MKYKVSLTLNYELEAENKDDALNQIESILLKEFNTKNPLESFNIDIQTKTLHEDLNEEEDIEHFVETYRKLFPPGTKDGTQAFRGDKQGCIDKMKWFIKAYPQYSQKDILEAAKEYVYQSRVRGKLLYIQQANHFIRKNKDSNLAAFCEAKGSKEEVNKFQKDI